MSMSLLSGLKRDASGGASGIADGGLVPLLTRLLGGQRALYMQILALARDQGFHVAAGESEALMALLAARHRLIEQVAPLDRELTPYKGRWQEVLDGLPTPDRGIVGGLLKEVQALLGEILELDEKAKESLTRQKSEIGTEISRTLIGAAAARAYGKR